MELTRIGDEGAPARVLRSAWLAWWACAISWFIALIRLGAMFLSNVTSGQEGSSPDGAYGTVYDVGFAAVTVSTVIALILVVRLAWFTRRGGKLAIAVILLIIGGVIFVYFREFAAWMVAAKGLFAFTPRMVRLDAIYTVLTLLTLFFASTSYFGQSLVAIALLLTAIFLVVSARRWLSVERIVEDVRERL